jgi:hypothetical protein
MALTKSLDNSGMRYLIAQTILSRTLKARPAVAIITKKSAPPDIAIRGFGYASATTPIAARCFASGLDDDPKHEHS